MKGIGYLGKLLFSLPLVMFGVFHFKGANELSGMVPSFIPYPIIWVYATGVAMVLAAIAIVLDKKAKLAAILLGVMLLSFALMIHLSGFINMDQISSVNFLKDIMLAGGAFALSTQLKS